MAADRDDVIVLTNNINLEDSLNINKTVNIDLNNHNIEAKEKVFIIQGGSLKLTGKGVISESMPNYGAIMLFGSDDSSKTEFSTVSVGSDVTLRGWSGIFINHLNNTGYGINVNMDGTIDAVNDINGGPGIGIYVNGNIKNNDNCPIINLSKSSKIMSSGNGIYSAGCSNYNINGAYIEGVESAIGIKSGSFKILDGTFIGNGPDKTPTNGNNNGINASGSSIQIESNPNYNGNININISDGNFISKNSNVIYEYTINNSSTNVKSFNISGGNFNSESGKDVFNLSSSFKNNHSSFIDGGIYTSDPTSYLKSGYNVVKDEGLHYKVVQNTMGVFKTNDKSNNTSMILTIVAVIVLFIIIFIKRQSILKFINSIIKR